MNQKAHRKKLRLDIVKNIHVEKTKYVIGPLTEHAKAEDSDMLYKLHWYGFPKEDTK